MALTVKNKLGLVDGTVKTPSEDEHAELQQWNHCNNLVKTWLLGSMSKDISSSIINCKDAGQIWLDLQERFSHANIVQLFHVENEIHDCVQGRRNTLLLEPLPIVNKAYYLVLRHEKQAEVSSGKHTSQSEAAAFAVKNDGHELELEDGGLCCGKCKKTNHNTKNCHAHLKCIFCGWKGHTFDYCRKRKAAVETEQSRSSTSKVNQVAVHDKRDGMPNFPFSQEDCK
ncbi:uncharacterized protein [Malus domestica]|uniref:uncharacterized protein n=1 Tax=Malus domestica TaxID=3750 RepID=UPI003974925B